MNPYHQKRACCAKPYTYDSLGAKFCRGCGYPICMNESCHYYDDYKEYYRCGQKGNSDCVARKDFSQENKTHNPRSCEECKESLTIVQKPIPTKPIFYDLGFNLSVDISDQPI